MIVKHYMAGKGFAMTPDGWLYPAEMGPNGAPQRLGTLALIISCGFLQYALECESIDHRVPLIPNIS